MDKEKLLNEAAKKYAKETYPNSIGKPYSQADFYSGAISDAAKEYWYERFQQEQSAGVWVKVSERLPKTEGVYTVKRRFSTEQEKAEYTGSVFTNYDGYKVIEWLDESKEQKQLSDEDDGEDCIDRICDECKTNGWQCTRFE